MSTRPPRLAGALLDRFLPGEEALVGDLIEEYASRRSRAWFWRQTLAAIAIGAFRRPDPSRPLRLLDGPAARGHGAPRSSASAGERGLVQGRRQVDLSAGPIAGIGGLGLLALATLITVVAPGAWWAVAAAVVAGVALGLVLVAIRRARIG
jgi:hypothetical protein